MSSPLPYPILVVSYNGETRDALVASLALHDVPAAPCASFCDAENLALSDLYSGMLVDLSSIIKSKGEEKIVAYTLTNNLPTLRVRSISSTVIPMSMPGQSRQDNSLNDFLFKTCRAYIPKKLRAYRRHPVCLSTLLRYKGNEFRGFTLNLSWGGAFIVDLMAERFGIGDGVGIIIPEFGFEVRAEVRRAKLWGMRFAPGIGLCFNELDEAVESVFAGILKTRKDFDRDRLIA